MSVTYKNNEIKLSPSEQKFNVDVVYARPEDIIKLDFVLDIVKITFVNGDVDIIFPNGSVISLASYGTLAFDSNAPKMYDVNGNLVTLETLLQKVQVLNPEDSVLILANRDKYQLVQNPEQVDRIIMATEETGPEDASGVPIAAVGDSPIKTKGVMSNLTDPTGTSYNFNLNRGIGDYLHNNYSTFLKGNTDTDHILPGNTFKEELPKLVYNFLFGDVGLRVGDRTINGQAADYYGIKFGVGENKDPKSQLKPIDMNLLKGNYQNKIFDAHAFDGKIKRTLHLDYSGGIFPQTIIISGIPKDVDTSGQRIFELVMLSGGSTKLTYDLSSNVYSLTQLDPVGKLKLQFIFKDSVPDQTLVIKYLVVYFDPKTSAQKVMETTQDIGIRTVSQAGDLSYNTFVINKGASGLIVNADKAGTGNKIFIGGNVENKFHSNSGNSLVFSGGGNDIIDLESGDNLIYGSTGYNLITGSGEKGTNWLVFSGEKKYNNSKYFTKSSLAADNKPFMESDVVKDNYYSTVKKGVSLQFYLGVLEKDVLDLWDQLGITGDPGGLKKHATSNFVRAFSSLTVIGNRNDSISITKIVGSNELDTFNLYFHGVKQRVELYSGKKNIQGVTDQIILHTIKGNNILVDFGRAEMSSITSDDGAAYLFQTYYFNRITAKGNGDFKVQLAYGNVENPDKVYSKDAYFVGGEGKNTADFSTLKFFNEKGHIEFNADIRRGDLIYYGVKGKTVDYFQNFNHIIGSQSNDIFYGSTNSNKFIFDGNKGDNTLTYERSPGGVTFDATEQKIYKVNGKNITDYGKYKATADMFLNINKIVLSGLDNVVLGAGNYNIGEKVQLWLGNSNNTLRYDYDANLTSIDVYSQEIKVVKDGDQNRIDKFTKNNTYGIIEYVGTKGKNTFHGGFKYTNIFNGGKGTENILTYEHYSSKEDIITVDLFKNTVFKSGKTDIYINIHKIVGGKGDDIFTLGNLDPTNKEHLKKLSNITIDGGGGNNVFRCNGVDTKNLSKDNFGLEFDVATGRLVFYDVNNKEYQININLDKNISTIFGTLVKNRFIASKDKNFTFDGSWVKTSYDPSKEKEAQANTLDYSHFKDGVVVDVINNKVIKGENKQDIFKNIQAFKTGKGNDTFIIRYSLETKLMFFDGGGGENTLEYQNTSVNMFFDFLKGVIAFNQEVSEINHYFKNITTFFGGAGENTFKLYDGALPFMSEKRESSVIIKLGSKISNSRTVIDFDYWKEAIGTSEKPFIVKAGKGSKSNGKEGKDSVTYEWENASGFIGSKQGNYFKIFDDEDSRASGVSFKLDGNKYAQNSVLDYSELKVEGLKLELNISEGSVNKLTKTTFARDTISNFKVIKLSKYDDTVKLLDVIKDNLKSLQLVDGVGGNNTLDFSLVNKDIDVEIAKDGLKLKGLKELSIVFINFNKMFATRGNSTFIVNDNSNGAKAEIIGNNNLGNNKYTILDLTAVKNVEYWNWVLEDSPQDSSFIGKLTWGEDKSANIISRNISQVKIGEGKNIIHGSLFNHTHYIGSNAEGTFNQIDYSNITKDTFTVTISGDKQSARFNHQGTKDDFTNFNYFKTTKGNDTFVIASLDKLNNITLDGNDGENTLSFTSLNKGIELDISTEELKIEKSILKIIKIQHLVLTQNNDTVIISNPDKKDLTFKTIDGNKSENTIDVRDGSALIFNEKGYNVLRFLNEKGENRHNEIKLNNIYHLKTNAVTGNRFYNNYNTSMKFEVVGVNDNNVANLLSYRNSAGVRIDFNKCEVHKGSTRSVDKFSGINYFEGSAVLVNTFYLAKTLGNPTVLDSNRAFKTIYINVDPNKPDNQGPNKDIIDISKVGDNAVLYVSKQQLDGSEIQYKWKNIGTFNLTNNQTIYVTFDESFKYKWVEPNDLVKNSTNASLIFSNKEGKGGQEYKDGYVIVDTTLEVAHTYDVNNKKLAEIAFSNISVIKGTGNNKDIFYGSIHNIEYYSSEAVKKGGFYKINEKDGTYGSGTLSYQKFLTNYGIKVIFNADNSATITENTNKNQTKKLDKAYGIRKYIGTLKDDSFVIAKNKGMGKITIDGNGGLFNNIDFSQTSSDSSKGIELDTTKGVSLGDFDYIFKNITTFKLTCNSDIVLGSLDNKGFLDKNSKEDTADIIIDANGGTDNTIDYTKYLKGTKDNIIKVNADLNSASISKGGKNEAGKVVHSNDTIAIVDPETKQATIKFQKIILNGEYVENILTVSGRESDNNIYVEIKNPTDGIIQLINFEFVNEKLDLVWDGQNINGKSTNILLTTLNRKYQSYIGFNSFALSRQDSTLTIKEKANLITNGGKLDGGCGRNTLIIDNINNKNSSIVINTNRKEIHLNFTGEKECTYNIVNFQAFYLGCMSNRFVVHDLSSYTIVFTNKEAYNEVSFMELNSSYLTLDFKSITNDGANLVVVKKSISNNQVNGKDTIYNIRNLVLTNNDDTVELVEGNIVNNKITIDGGKGYNSISFKKWKSEIDLSKINGQGNIEINNYILKNFTNVILRDKDDEITLNELSNINVDGGGGVNKVTYTGNFVAENEIGGVSIIEYSTKIQGGDVLYGVKVSKSSGKFDTLLRFSYFILPQNCNNLYIAQNININTNNPSKYTINFNWTKKDEEKISNTMDYSKLLDAKGGIYAKLDSSKQNNLQAEVWRDSSKKGVNQASTCIQDRLFNVGIIKGSSIGGDIFEISGIYNTYCTLNALGTKISTIHFLSENSKREKDNTTIWNLSDHTKNIINTGQEGYYLKFNGNIENILVVSTPKDNDVLDQEFVISDFNIAYNINYKLQGKVSNKSFYASLNLQRIVSDQQVRINITQIGDRGKEEFVQVTAKAGNSKELKITGIDYIVGSKKAQNVFVISHKAASNSTNRNICIIGNENYVKKGDHVDIIGSEFLKVMSMSADDKFGGIKLVTEGGKQSNYLIKYVTLFYIKNVQEFTFNLTNSAVYRGNYEFEVVEGSKFFINIAKGVKDLEAVLDVNGMYFNSRSMGLHFVANKIDKMTVAEDGKEVPIFVRNPKKDADFTFVNVFTTIDFYDFKEKLELNIGNTTKRWEIKFNNVTFAGNPDSSPTVKLKKNYTEGDKVTLNLDYKNINSLFKEVNIITRNSDTHNIVTYFNTDKTLYTNISINNDLINIANQYANSSSAVRGNINIHSINSKISFSSSMPTHYTFNISYSVNKGSLCAEIANIKSLSINLTKIAGDNSLATISHNSINIGNKLIFSPKELLTSNADFNFTLPNDFVIVFDKRFFNRYVDALVEEGRAKGKYIIKAQNPSDTNPTLIIKAQDQNVLSISRDCFLHITLDINKNGVLDYIFTGVGKEPEQYKTEFILKGIKAPDVSKAIGFWNIKTQYYITNMTGSLVLGGDVASKPEQEWLTRITYVAKDGKEVDINGGSIVLNINRYSGYGVLNGSILTTHNIIEFDFTKVVNCKSFQFNISDPELTILRDKKRLYISAPKISPDKCVIRDLKDLKNYADHSMYVSMPSELNIDCVFSGIYANQNGIGGQAMFQKVSWFNYFNINRYTFSINYNLHVYLGGECLGETSFIINVVWSKFERHERVLDYTVYSHNVNKMEYVKGSVLKNGKVYDICSGFTKIKFKAKLVNIYITEQTTKATIYNEKEDPICDFVIEGSETKLFIQLDSIPDIYNNSVLFLNDIKDLHFTHEGVHTYKVFFVKSNEYCNKNNNMATFDTNGYFVIFDCDTKNKVYFTGKNIEKFSKIFEASFKQNIKIVYTYKELLEAFNNSALKTDIFLNETLGDLDEADITINYENNNHSSNIFLVDEEDEEVDKPAEDFNTLYQEIQSSEQDTDTYHNNSDNSSYYNTEEEINILSEEDNSDSIYNLSAEEVLEFTSEDIDTIFNNSIDNFLETKDVTEGEYITNNTDESINNGEDSNDLVDIIEELSSVEDINIDNNKDTILINETTLDSDPSVKVEDSMNKQNTLNGNNFK